MAARTLCASSRRIEPCGANAGARIVIGEDDVWPAGKTADVAAVPPGVMIMHDYDLGRVIALFHLHGFRSVHLDHTDHGGPIGAVIHARPGKLVNSLGGGTARPPVARPFGVAAVG